MKYFMVLVIKRCFFYFFLGVRVENFFIIIVNMEKVVRMIIVRFLVKVLFSREVRVIGNRLVEDFFIC